MQKMTWIILSAMLTMLVAESAEAARFGRSGFGRSWSRSRSMYSRPKTKPHSSSSKPKTSKSTPSKSTAEDNKSVPQKKAPAAASTPNSSSGGMGLGTMALIYLATRPNTASGKSAPVPKECSCSAEGVPTPACPADVKCEPQSTK